MMVMGPTSSMFDVLTISMLLLLFQADVAFFRTGWFVETLATQILWIFAVRTRRHLFASRPHRAVAGLAFGTAALTVALPFLPGIGRWFEFVHPPASYFPFLLAVIVAFLVTTELVNCFFYAHMAQIPIVVPGVATLPTRTVRPMSSVGSPAQSRPPDDPAGE